MNVGVQNIVRLASGVEITQRWVKTYLCSNTPKEFHVSKTTSKFGRFTPLRSQKSVSWLILLACS